MDDRGRPSRLTCRSFESSINRIATYTEVARLRMQRVCPSLPIQAPLRLARSELCLWWGLGSARARRSPSAAATRPPGGGGPPDESRSNGRPTRQCPTMGYGPRQSSAPEATVEHRHSRGEAAGMVQNSDGTTMEQSTEVKGEFGASAYTSSEQAVRPGFPGFHGPPSPAGVVVASVTQDVLLSFVRSSGGVLRSSGSGTSLALLVSISRA